MKSITIDSRLCKKCGICVEFCPVKTYIRQNDGMPLPKHQEKCTGCKFCEYWCPEFAIKVEVTDDGNK